MLFSTYFTLWIACFAGIIEGVFAFTPRVFSLLTLDNLEIENAGLRSMKTMGIDLVFV